MLKSNKRAILQQFIDVDRYLRTVDTFDSKAGGANAFTKMGLTLPAKVAQEDKKQYDKLHNWIAKNKKDFQKLMGEKRPGDIQQWLMDPNNRHKAIRAIAANLQKPENLNDLTVLNNEKRVNDNTMRRQGLVQLQKAVTEHRKTIGKAVTPDFQDQNRANMATAQSSLNDYDRNAISEITSQCQDKQKDAKEYSGYSDIQRFLDLNEAIDIADEIAAERGLAGSNPEKSKLTQELQQLCQKKPDILRYVIASNAIVKMDDTGRLNPADLKSLQQHHQKDNHPKMLILERKHPEFKYLRLRDLFNRAVRLNQQMHAIQSSNVQLKENNNRFLPPKDVVKKINENNKRIKGLMHRREQVMGQANALIGSDKSLVSRNKTRINNFSKRIKNEMTKIEKRNPWIETQATLTDAVTHDVTGYSRRNFTDRIFNDGYINYDSSDLQLEYVQRQLQGIDLVTRAVNDEDPNPNGEPIFERGERILPAQISTQKAVSQDTPLVNNQKVVVLNQTINQLLIELGHNNAKPEYCSWMNKEIAAVTLANQQVGSYLVRPSGSIEGQFVISVKVDPSLDGVHHFSFYQNDLNDDFIAKVLREPSADFRSTYPDITVFYPAGDTSRAIISAGAQYTANQDDSSDAFFVPLPAGPDNPDSFVHDFPEPTPIHNVRAADLPQINARNILPLNQAVNQGLIELGYNNTKPEYAPWMTKDLAAMTLGEKPVGSYFVRPSGRIEGQYVISVKVGQDANAIHNFSFPQSELNDNFITTMLRDPSVEFKKTFPGITAFYPAGDINRAIAITGSTYSASQDNTNAYSGEPSAADIESSDEYDELGLDPYDTSDHASSSTPGSSARPLNPSGVSNNALRSSGEEESLLDDSDDYSNSDPSVGSEASERQNREKIHYDVLPADTVGATVPSNSAVIYSILPTPDGGLDTKQYQQKQKQDVKILHKAIMNESLDSTLNGVTNESDQSSFEKMQVKYGCIAKDRDHGRDLKKVLINIVTKNNQPTPNAMTRAVANNSDGVKKDTNVEMNKTSSTYTKS